MLSSKSAGEKLGLVAAGVAAASVAYALYKKIHIPGRVVDTERHGGDLVADVLKAHGVEFLFTLVGGHISPILVSAKREGIRIIDVRHEVTGVFAADAVARLTGVPGVCAVTAGPGVTNTITAVKNAQMAESPVVLLGGAAATLTQGRGALQDIDQLSVLKPIVKYAASCRTVRDIVPTLRRAFKEAMSGVPGPVFVELPLDVLYPINEVRTQTGLATRLRTKELKPEQHSELLLPEEVEGNVTSYLSNRRPDQPVFLKKDTSRMPWVERVFMQYAVRNIYSGAFDHTPDFTPLPVVIPTPRSWEVSRVAKLIRSAKNPVMIVASQATLFQRAEGSDPTRPIDDLRAAVESLGIPTFLSGMARGLLGRNGRLHVRQNRRGALKEADVVILAGAVPDFRLDYGRQLKRSSKIVAINRGSAALKQNTDWSWKPTVAVQADPATFLIQLAKELGTEGARFADWAAKLKSAEADKEAANLKKSKQPAYGRDGGTLINPLDLGHRIEEVLPEKSVLIGDGGDFVATMSYIVRPRGPLTWEDPGQFGTLGVGGGFALGTKLCRPDHEVWLLWGDGSAGYSVAEVDTFKRHGLSFIAVVGNDACWTQIEREQVPIFGDTVACPLLYTPYDDVAKGYGGEGLTVSKPTEDVTAALKECQRHAAEGRPVLLNVNIGTTDFREGSLSV